MARKVPHAALWGVSVLFSTALAAEQLRFDAVDEWRTWRLPLGIIALDNAGVIRPVEIRKNVDPVLDAVAFGGGIRAAGSNRQAATRAIDGDRLTGWSPDLADDPDDWWIEIDLGRAVAARRVALTFLETAPPCALFDVLLSTGEPAIDVVGNPIEGSLVYRVQERFKENQRQQVALELDPVRDPFVQFIRVEVLDCGAEAALAEVEVEAIGDNLSLDLAAKGGGLEIIVDIDGFGDAASFANSLPLADGRFSLWTENRRINRPVDVISRMTLDLGAVYWVDLVRIVGNFLSRPGQFRFNFDRYEVLTADGGAQPHGQWHAANGHHGNSRQKRLRCPIASSGMTSSSRPLRAGSTPRYVAGRMAVLGRGLCEQAVLAVGLSRCASPSPVLRQYARVGGRLGIRGASGCGW